MKQEFRNLLLFCPHPREDLDLIVSGGDIGHEGWALLAKTVQLRPGFVERIRCRHRVQQEAKKEDMKVIWEVFGDIELVHELGNGTYSKRNGDVLWRRLVQVMDMSKDELVRNIEMG